MKPYILAIHVIRLVLPSMSHTFGCKLRHPWEDRPKAGMESFDAMCGGNFHRYLRTSYITCREMWLRVLKVPPCATDQVICARIIEPRQRSPHFCCHQTFMCWHSLTSCLPLTHGPLVHVDLPFNRLPSTQKKQMVFPQLSLSAKRKLLHSGHCETSTSLPCPGVSRVREKPRGEETRLAWRTHWSGPAGAAAWQTRQALLWATVAIICQVLQLHFTKLLFEGKRQSNKM